jgi:hypothetical protein
MVPIASASLADNGAMHTVAVDTLTVFDVVHANPFFSCSRRLWLDGVWRCCAVPRESCANANGHERQARVHPASLSRCGRPWRNHCSRHAT